jgi:predicted RNA-binding Zn ribbon-like protein
MSTLLSQGNWSAADHSADIALRETTYRALIKKYDAEIETDAKNEFITKLDQAAALSAKIEGTPEEYARASLDKASVLIGEVEAELSMLGQVEIRDRVIVDIDFSVNLVPEQ